VKDSASKYAEISKHRYTSKLAEAAARRKYRADTREVERLHIPRDMVATIPGGGTIRVKLSRRERDRIRKRIGWSDVGDEKKKATIAEALNLGGGERKDEKQDMIAVASVMRSKNKKKIDWRDGEDNTKPVEKAANVMNLVRAEKKDRIGIPTVRSRPKEKVRWIGAMNQTTTNAKEERQEANEMDEMRQEAKENERLMEAKEKDERRQEAKAKDKRRQEAKENERLMEAKENERLMEAKENERLMEAKENERFMEAKENERRQEAKENERLMEAKEKDERRQEAKETILKERKVERSIEGEKKEKPIPTLSVKRGRKNLGGVKVTMNVDLPQKKESEYATGNVRVEKKESLSEVMSRISSLKTGPGGGDAGAKGGTTSTELIHKSLAEFFIRKSETAAIDTSIPTKSAKSETNATFIPDKTKNDYFLANKESMEASIVLNSVLRVVKRGNEKASVARGRAREVNEIKSGEESNENVANEEIDDARKRRKERKHAAKEALLATLKSSHPGDHVNGSLPSSSSPKPLPAAPYRKEIARLRFLQRQRLAKSKTNAMLVSEENRMSGCLFVFYFCLCFFLI
jgi:hypothetical protein